MTLGEKIKEMRKKFGLSQEELASIMNVSRQAITKWESDGGLPDISNLQELSKVFGITIDYLLDNNNDLPLMVMKKQINKEKYKNKISSYSEILKENYPSPWEIYVLSKNPKMNKIESILNLITGGDYYLIKDCYGLSAENTSQIKVLNVYPDSGDDITFTTYDGENVTFMSTLSLFSFLTLNTSPSSST